MNQRSRDIIVKRVRYLNTVVDFVNNIPRLAKGPATESAADYLIAKLAFYPVYQFYGRAQAYPEAAALHPEAWVYMGPGGVPKMHKPVPGYFSLKQFRYVMSLKSHMDFGVPHRTGNLQRSWGKRGTRTGVVIYNTDPAAKWVMSDKYQARQPAGAGWSTTGAIIERERDNVIMVMSDAIMAEMPYKQKRAKNGRFS